ncbi:MAG: Nif3-like dinuclear metal center hexameric protein [Clostridia bacterium]|nr:Nif3-like dinuclear metal center hexameric protein [Clostridia bacterium]
MKVKELYERLSEIIPENLSEPWDNDGLMCSADMTSEVNNVLITLDVTEEIVDYAIERNFDLIISHHPLIFSPINKISEDLHVSRKIIKLITNNVSVFSFHTRADKVEGGVNDILAGILGLSEVTAFGEGNMGRIGILPEDYDLEQFADVVKMSLGADSVKISDAYNPVKRVALVGGDGKSFVKDAILAGADTYLSGRISYNVMEEAAEMGINLIEAGHYFTEYPVTEFFSRLVSGIDGNAYIEIADSNMIKSI